MKRFLKETVKVFGFDVSRITESNRVPAEFPSDFEDEYVDVIKKCRPYTMTSNERLYQLMLCVKYIVQNNIKGDFVECGVWRGGSILAMIETLKMLGISDRQIHLFDTFSSQDIFATKEPTEADTPFNSTREELRISLAAEKVDFSVNVADVRNLMAQTGYPEKNLSFHVGRVEDTIPVSSIDSISLLRLDTDWYDSTKVQLESFYHRVSLNGVVIFDDYGFWKGHKKAVDEFLNSHRIQPLMIRNDQSCRFLIKTDCG